MHRRPLLDLIDRYSEKYPEEAETVSRFREFISRRADCFERELKEGHITGSAWIVDRCGERVLLTHHRKLNIWVQLGGHADGEADIASVALKEAYEESGLDSLKTEPEIFDLDIHPIPARKSDPEHLHYDVRFVIRNEGVSDFIVSEESHDLAWIDLEDIETLTTEESILRMRRKWTNSGNA
ncbi:MAG: NUDIX hydrolase [Verrucomicrobiales bacterium]|nr:NUDIX hydrolase [Verrucomicrobiales bacterium]